MVLAVDGSGRQWCGPGVAHAISPDARSRHPAFRSLDAALASPSRLRSASNAVSIGMGAPEQSNADSSECTPSARHAHEHGHPEVRPAGV
jgi:hypothetical protein